MLPSSSRSLPNAERDVVHRWYRIIMGFDSTIVSHLIDRLSISPLHRVLDPFCGSGTTLVECKKRGLPSLGIDANPVCIFASRVKTNWRLQPMTLAASLPEIIAVAHRIGTRDPHRFINHPTFSYLNRSGMIARGWLSITKALKLLALDEAIRLRCAFPSHRAFFRLALLSAMVRQIANIKFAPEVYCLSKPKRRRVFTSFRRTADRMIKDLAYIHLNHRDSVGAHVLTGDSRHCDDLLRSANEPPVDFIITSPPYPNEHDYTRCTRLELVYLGYVRNTPDLRGLKRIMLRSHSKGIYIDDNEERLCRRFKRIQRLKSRLERRARNRTDGFAQLYGKTVAEYFGGMIAHLKAAYNCLKPNGIAAYVLADQQTYLGVHVDTPRIITKLATSSQVGFHLMDVINWKTTRGSTGTKFLTEEILLFSKPRR